MQRRRKQRTKIAETIRITPHYNATTNSTCTNGTAQNQDRAFHYYPSSVVVSDAMELSLQYFRSRKRRNSTTTPINECFFRVVLFNVIGLYKSIVDCRYKHCSLSHAYAIRNTSRCNQADAIAHKTNLLN